MPRRCTVCAHAERDRIDAALLAGEANRAIARRFGIDRSALARHRKAHVSARLIALEGEREEARGDQLIEAGRKLSAGALVASDVLGGLLRSDNERVRLGAARSIIEQAARLRETVELEERVQELERQAGQEGGVA